MCAEANFSDKDVYNVNYSKPGIVVIINNITLKNDAFYQKESSEKDVNRLFEVFSDLNFEVESHYDLDAIQLKNCIRKYSKRDYSVDDCFICFIMSHGDQIISSDYKDIYLDTLVDPFKYNPSLKSKPKLFFIQTFDTKPLAFNAALEEESSRRGFSNTKIESDFLICNFTVKVNYSRRRNPTSASIFIQNLCDEIRRNTGKNILEILTSVKKQVVRTYATMSIDSRLSKNLYLTQKKKSSVIYSIY